MGNRSSSHYPPAPWIHGSYPGLCSEGKRGLSGQPGAYTESYLPHPSLHKSMVSLNADSGYMTSPGDSDRMRMRGSRMSLNHMELDRTVVVHDAKTLKKLEKIEKKQKKLFKKMGAQLAPRVVPMAYALHPSHYPGPAQMYGRAISYDDLHRAQRDMEDLRVREKWRVTPAMRVLRTHIIDGNNKSSISSSHKALSRHTGRGSVASSPVTSSSEGYTAEMWRDSLPRHQINGSRTGESVLPLGNSTCLSSTPQFLARRSPALIPYSITPSQRRVAPIQEEVAKTVEVKVQRSERTERTEKMENKEWTNKNATYAEPIVRGQPSYGSRSSLATSHLRGEPSEIDFSWVHEEENRLKDERDRTKSLPECYFGMDPPIVEDNQRQSQAEAKELEEKENKEKERLWNIRKKAVLLEHEAMRKRKEHGLRARSSAHFEEPQPDYFPIVERTEISGPAERRLQKIQREDVSQKGRVYEANHRDQDRQRWRSSIAF